MGSPWIFVAVAFAIGGLVGYLLGRAARPAAAEADGNGPPREAGVYEAKKGGCPKCGRLLLAGVKRCPFCHPVIPDVPLEGTLSADHKPLDKLVAMPGLSAAALQTRQAGARGYLHVFTGLNKGESILLETMISIGRASEMTLILKDEGVSQKHAEVRLRGDNFYVKDLGSKNGTFVNDQKVAEKRLAPGDVISVGDTKMLFQAV
jgi:hypothetical protein